MIKSAQSGHLESCTIVATDPKIRRLGCTCTLGKAKV